MIRISLLNEVIINNYQMILIYPIELSVQCTHLHGNTFMIIWMWEHAASVAESVYMNNHNEHESTDAESMRLAWILIWLTFKSVHPVSVVSKTTRKIRF